jgi:glyoxylase-like metal-dependent hydrolase (beta-lactamase superfamily II)
MNPDVKYFYHEPSGTLSYVVSDPSSGAAAIVDPVLGYDAASGRTDTVAADAMVDYVESKGLSIEWILETHAHADHLTSAPYLKERLGGRIAIGEGIRKVQAHFSPVFNLKAPFVADGSQFDHLFSDGESFAIGELTGSVMHTPGHTNDSVTYVVGNAAFVGDTVFMTDYGTARCDFPGGDAALLFDSIQKLFALPDDTTLYLCHDYPPGGRDMQASASVAEQREKNVHIGGDTGKEDFVAMRESRDAELDLPALILPSIQVNIRAGGLPDAEDNGIAYIKIPLDHLQ